jgi:hypothetical protein
MAVDQVQELLSHPKPVTTPTEFRAAPPSAPAAPGAQGTTFMLDSVAREVENDVVTGESAIVQKLLKGLTVAALIFTVGAASLIMWSVSQNLSGYIAR